MENRIRKQKKLWKTAALTVLILAAAAMVCGYCVFQGYILLNHPSRRQFPVRGVDVSHYQGSIDWNVLKDQGMEFSYIKATEGSGHTDGRFLENWDGARDAGIRAGAYHFFSFDSPAKNQLEHFINTVPAYREMLPPTVDFEFYGDKKVNPPPVEASVEQLTILLEGLESYYGVKPVVYATKEAWEMYLKGRFDQYPLWIRSVITQPGIPDSQLTFWQYSNRGRLEGYEGGDPFIDLNAFRGSREEWEEWAGSYSRALDQKGVMEELDRFGLLIPDGCQSTRSGGRLTVSRELSEDSYQMLRLRVSCFPMPKELLDIPDWNSFWCLEKGQEMTSGLPMRVKSFPTADGGMIYQAVDRYTGEWAAPDTVWFLPHSGQIYAVEEVCTAEGEDFPSFLDFIRQGRVFLDGKALRLKSENETFSLCKETVAEDIPVWLETVCHETGETVIRVYDGQYAEQEINNIPFQTSDVRARVEEDVNFDGYRDLYITEGNSQSIYLWDPKYGRFADETDYGPLLSPGIYTSFSLDSQEKRIELRRINQDRLITNIYGLAQWRDGRLILRRKLVFPSAYQEGTGKPCPVRVVDYPDGTVLDGPFYDVPDREGTLLFEKEWTAEEYQEKESLAATAFYDGLPFTSDYIRQSPSDGLFYDTGRIPESLKEYIRSAMKEKREKEALLAIRQSEELTLSQVKELAAKNPSLDRWVREIAVGWNGEGTFVAADGDGDGISDISAEIYLGGTGGFTQFVFFKGMEDGTYRETSNYSHIREEFAYIGWEGRPYLIRTSYDYGAKQYDGFCIYAYEDGKRTGAVWLELVPEDFSAKTEIIQPEYGSYAAQIAKEGLSSILDTKEWPYHIKVVVGSSETALDDRQYSSDVFNTGQPVAYDKHIWYSSNMYTRDGASSDLIPQFPDVLWAELEQEITMFWIEKMGDENVVCFLLRNGVLDYTVRGWRFDGRDSGAELFRIMWTGSRDVRELPLSIEKDIP